MHIITPTDNSSNMKYKVLLVFLVLVLIFLRLQSAINSLKPFYLTLEPLILRPHATYDEKMSTIYPVYFDYITAVKSLTPEDSTIYLPPPTTSFSYENEMRRLTNLAITSALLFPRNVSFFDDKSLINTEKNTYVVITNGFPQIKIKAKQIYIIGENVENGFGNYDPTSLNNSVNGLIQI